MSYQGSQEPLSALSNFQVSALPLYDFFYKTLSHAKYNIDKFNLFTTTEALDYTLLIKSVPIILSWLN